MTAQSGRRRVVAVLFSVCDVFFSKVEPVELGLKGSHQVGGQVVTMFAGSNKCHATSNRCLTSSNKVRY